jgi:hypothetical protein
MLNANYFASSSLGTPEHGAQKFQKRPKIFLALVELLRNLKNYKKRNLNTKIETKKTHNKQLEREITQKM